MPGFINTRAHTHMHTFTPPHTRTHICTHSHTPPASTTTAHVPRVRRWLAIGIPAYVRSGWNQLDMVVVALSIMSVVLENTQGVEGASPRFVQVRAPVCAPSRHAHPQVCAHPCVRQAGTRTHRCARARVCACGCVAAPRPLCILKHTSQIASVVLKSVWEVLPCSVHSFD